MPGRNGFLAHPSETPTAHPTCLPSPPTAAHPTCQERTWQRAKWGTPRCHMPMPLGGGFANVARRRPASRHASRRLGGADGSCCRAAQQVVIDRKRSVRVACTSMHASCDRRLDPASQRTTHAGVRDDGAVTGHIFIRCIFRIESSCLTRGETKVLSVAQKRKIIPSLFHRGEKNLMK